MEIRPEKKFRPVRETCKHYEIATCNIIQIIMRLEENHKFLIIKTSRSVLFFNRVISSVACPKTK